MKLRHLYIALLASAFILLAGVTGFSDEPGQVRGAGILPGHSPVQVSLPADSYSANVAFEGRKNKSRQSFYQRFTLNWDQFKADNGAAKAPTASASQLLLLNISSTSPDESSSFLLKHLLSAKPSAHFSFTRQLLIQSFFKKLSLLPMAGCTAIGAP